jgi:hypothetical protein
VRHLTILRFGADKNARQKVKVLLFVAYKNICIMSQEFFYNPALFMQKKKKLCKYSL